MDRRTFIAAAAAALALPSASAASPGSSATADAVRGIRSLGGVSEGSGRGTVYVLFAPWCPESRGFYAASREFLNRLSFWWAPIPGGLPEGLEPTERILESGRPGAVAEAFSVRWEAPSRDTPLAFAQDARLVSDVAPLLRRDMGHGLATPTIGYLIGSDRARLLRGNPGPGALAEIAAHAS